MTEAKEISVEQLLEDLSYSWVKIRHNVPFIFE